MYMYMYMDMYMYMNMYMYMLYDVYVYMLTICYMMYMMYMYMLIICYMMYMCICVYILHTITEPLRNFCTFACGMRCAPLSSRDDRSSRWAARRSCSSEGSTEGSASSRRTVRPFLRHSTLGSFRAPKIRCRKPMIPPGKS